jgi:hypothetical protein
MMRSKLFLIGVGLLVMGVGTLALDITPPNSQATVSPAPNALNWNNSPVVVTITAQDNGGSGVKEIRYQIDGGPVTVVPGAMASFSLSAEAIHTVRYWAVDGAGNVELQNTLRVGIDLTPPRIAVRVPDRGARYILHQVAIADWFAYDRLSGLADVSAPARAGEALDTSSAGFRAFVVRAVDRAGNAAVEEVSYRVAYVIAPTGPAGAFLDRPLPPEEVRQVGEFLVLARYCLSKPIQISFALFDAFGRPVAWAIPSLTVSEVRQDEEGKERHTIWAWHGIPHAGEGQYVLAYPTEGRAPGIYDLWIGFGDGHNERIRVELVLCDH